MLAKLSEHLVPAARSAHPADKNQEEGRARGYCYHRRHDLLLCNLREIPLSMPVFGDSMPCRNPQLEGSIWVLPLAAEPVLLHWTLRCSRTSASVCCSELLLSFCLTSPNKLGTTALQSGLPWMCACMTRSNKMLQHVNISEKTNCLLKKWTNKETNRVIVAAASWLNLINIWETEA